MRESIITLRALDGANPLGFLAALGVLSELSGTGSESPPVALGWRAGARWIPFLQFRNSLTEDFVTEAITKKLRGTPVAAEAEQKREAAQNALDEAKIAVKNAEGKLKARKLRGQDRQAARKKEVEPFEHIRDQARKALLAALKEAVASPELALGQRPDCTIEEFRERAAFSRSNAQLSERISVDLLASFGAETASATDERIEPTPFCFITGSGHQWFLDTARQLMRNVSKDKVREALFESWAYRDEKLSMRWDPFDDRRYALMDRDPTASDNKSRTVWMANLLAYRALVLFPSACGPYGRPLTSCWARDRRAHFFTWPLWEMPLTSDSVRSLLQHSAFSESDLSYYRRELRERGVKAVFRNSRIQVGNPPLHKINFTPTTGL
jgi:hypothetical protein